MTIQREGHTGATHNRSFDAIKIAIVAASLPMPDRKRGGVDIAIHRLANALASIGKNVTVLAPCEKPTDAVYDHRYIFKPYAFLFKFKIGRLFLFPFFLNFLNVSVFDVVHLNGDDWFYFFFLELAPRPFFAYYCQRQSQAF